MRRVVRMRVAKGLAACEDDPTKWEEVFYDAQGDCMMPVPGSNKQVHFHPQ